MKRAFSDPWALSLALVMLLSGAFAVQSRFGAAHAPSAHVPAPAPAAPASPVAGATLSGTGPLSGPLKPKTPGQWLVDLAGAPDSDSADLAAVLFYASEGDVITVRQGV